MKALEGLRSGGGLRAKMSKMDWGNKGLEGFVFFAFYFAASFVPPWWLFLNTLPPRWIKDETK
jgi:hypothetical protein